MGAWPASLRAVAPARPHPPGADNAPPITEVSIRHRFRRWLATLVTAAIAIVGLSSPSWATSSPTFATGGAAFTPQYGAQGSTVVIAGTNLDGVTQVLFGYDGPSPCKEIGRAHV